MLKSYWQSCNVAFVESKIEGSIDETLTNLITEIDKDFFYDTIVFNQYRSVKGNQIMLGLCFNPPSNNITNLQINGYQIKTK